ncbi:NnrU family protein [Roseovarius sp.]|uniref:NnrU family protein n=1 Tax=Roseovarius sp. TaxID=1486281 RepID=UPI003B5C56EC
MGLLIAGVLLWTGAHLFKRIAPGPRAAMGTAGKAVIAVLLLVSIWMMTKGYQAADGAVFWGRHPMTVGINNLLMLLSVYMFAASGMKTALARRMRHPMLGAVKVWALAHLLVNGDVPSFILFGGLLAWAVIEMIVINKSQPEWVRPDPAPKSKEIAAVAGSVVVYGLIVAVHYWLGYPAFG